MEAIPAIEKKDKFLKHDIVNQLFQLGYSILKRLDQGHLHPSLEVPRLTCPDRESDPQASTLETSHSNSLLIAIWNIYI
jgi:hypothetical protein